MVGGVRGNLSAALGFLGCRFLSEGGAGTEARPYRAVGGRDDIGAEVALALQGKILADSLLNCRDLRCECVNASSCGQAKSLLLT
jgi:hypothetical protein